MKTKTVIAPEKEKSNFFNFTDGDLPANTHTYFNFKTAKTDDSENKNYMERWFKDREISFEKFN